MYYAIVGGLMFLFPALSILVDLGPGGHEFGIALVAKWYAFWACGLRLGLAGLRQIVQPEFTAREILGLKSDDAIILVRELGFANAGFGAVGVVSLWQADWRVAAALAAGIFYALAAINHARDGERNTQQNVALFSDAFAGIVLLGLCVGAALR